MPDGERILTWQQIWDLTELPEHLIVIGSGVTGAELAHSYLGLGCAVTLISSRDRVLPGEDADEEADVEGLATATRNGEHPVTRGLLRGIEDGWFMSEIAEAAFQYQVALEKKEKKMNMSDDDDGRVDYTCCCSCRIFFSFALFCRLSRARRRNSKK